MQTKSAKLLTACLMAMLLGGCAQTGDECLLFNPVYTHKDDYFTDATARQILANNETGAKECGWKKRKK